MYLNGEYVGFSKGSRIPAEFDVTKYQGPWMYELELECPATILRDRSLVCEDFTRNAKELFNNEPISIFSKPKPNLGMWE